MDTAWAGRAHAVDPLTELQLEQVYSRGLGPYFINGTGHQAVVRGRAPRHRGVLMGRVARIADGVVAIEPAAAHSVSPIKPGDGVVFDAADWRSPEEPEEGGRIFQVEPRAGRLDLRFGNGVVDITRIRPGDLVWRTHDPDLDKAARPFTEAAAPLRKQPVSVRVIAAEGEPLESEWSVGNARVTVRSNESLGRARNRTMDEEYLRAQLGRLGNTPYELAELRLEVDGAPFAPASVLNQMRRDAVERLQQAQSAVSRVGLRACPSREAAPAISEAQPTIHLLVRTPEQLDAALEVRPASITLDYLDLYGLLLHSTESAPPAGTLALRVRASSSRAKKRSPTFSSAGNVRSWCAPPVCCTRSANARNAS